MTGDLLTKTVHRTVTNISAGGTYRAHVQAPPGFSVRVRPQEFHIGKGQSKTFEVTISHVSAPAAEWRFGSLTFRDDRGSCGPEPDCREGEADRIRSFGDRRRRGRGLGLNRPGFRLQRTIHAGRARIVGTVPGLLSEHSGRSGQSVQLRCGRRRSRNVQLPTAGRHDICAVVTVDAYVDGAHDLDLYLFYCPPDPLANCELVDVSFTFTSEERVSVDLPEVDDPSTDADGYFLFVHAFETEGGTPASIFSFDWAGERRRGQYGRHRGPERHDRWRRHGERELVRLAHRRSRKASRRDLAQQRHGPLGVTSVNVANDGDAGYDDLCAVLPPGFLRALMSE